MALTTSVISRGALTFLLLILILLVNVTPARSAGKVGVRLGTMRFSQNVESMADLRWKKLTRQGWDMSCGAAA